jgi:phosphoribosylformylglycinamidine (FGAM) synthase-like enzyme
MSPLHAQSIIKTLAKGIDPETGEILSKESPFNNTDVVRALNVALKHMQAAHDTAQASPANNGKPWTAEEERKLLRAYDSGTTNASIEAAHERSAGGIAARLVKLGRLEEPRHYLSRSRKTGHQHPAH